MTSYLTSMDAIFLYLVPFSIYSTSKFSGFDLDLWPLKSHLVSKNSYTIRKPIYNFLSDLYGQYFSLSYHFRDIRLQSFMVRHWLWTLKVIWGQKYLYHSKAHIWLPIWYSMDNISLSCAVFEIFNFKVFRFWPWPLTPKGHLGSKFLIPFESLYMTSYLTSIEQHLSISYRFRDIRLQSF